MPVNEPRSEDTPWLQGALGEGSGAGAGRDSRMPFSGKIRFGGVALLVLAASSLAGQNTGQAAMQDAVHSAPIDLTHGKPFVMVMIDGQGPFRFLIDTGTGAQVLVAPELADRLHLPRAGEARLTDASGLADQSTNFVLIESLSFAGTQFNWIEGVEHQLPDQDGACDGLLGFALFRDYLLTLDFPNRRITLGSGELSPDHSVLPFRMPDGIPIVTLHIGALDVDAQLDSGGSGLSLPEPLAPELKFASPPEVFGNEQSLSTRYEVKAARLDSNVRFGAFTFEKPFVEINPVFPLANFGSSPMQDFAMTFDQENLLMRLDATRKVLHLDAPPSAVHLRNAPVEKPPTLPLVPVG